MAGLGLGRVFGARFTNRDAAEVLSAVGRSPSARVSQFVREALLAHARSIKSFHDRIEAELAPKRTFVPTGERHPEYQPD